MSDSSTRTNTAANFRNAFDQMYAIPASLDRTEQMENLLAIRLSGDLYAIRVSQITGLTESRKTIALPSTIPELLGVTGIRGGLVPVYSLTALLGYNLDRSPSRWLALCGSEETVGLAFRDFEGYLKIPSTQVYAAIQDNVIREHVKDVARAAGVVRAVVNISSILDTIKKRCGDSRVSKER